MTVQSKHDQMLALVDRINFSVNECSDYDCDDCDLMTDAADALTALLEENAVLRTEKHADAEAIGALRAERDTTWNKAIETAAQRNNLTVQSIKEAMGKRDWDAARKIAMKGPSAIRSLRKGGTT